MNDSVFKLRIATVTLLALVLIALMMNTCAIDRIEQQVIDQRKALERLATTSGGGAGARPQGPAVPGEPTGRRAVGWGGRQADILHVAGVPADAPLAISEKPLPQNDWYVRRRSSPPSSLNYYTTNESETRQVARFVHGRLLHVDYDSPPGVTPALATHWEISDDKLTYTYHLRKGAQHADGRPVTSADLKFSFDVMRDPEVKAEHLRPKFEDVSEVLTPDDYTFVVKYKRKYWKGLYVVGSDLYILNKGWYEEEIPKWAAKLDISSWSIEPGKPGFGEVFNRINIPCPGAGPYYFYGDEFDLKSPVEIVQNPFWWGIQGHPTWYNLVGIRWLWISDEVAAFEEFRKQKFDISVVDFQPWDDEYSSDPTITGISNYFEYDHTGLAQSFIAWNCRKPPFDDPRVRRAMTHLTNRQFILDEIERGRGQIASFPTKPIYPTYSHDIEPIPFDIEKARALLAEAGWKDTDGDGVLDRDGQRFEFEFKIGSPRRFYIQVSAALEDACKKVGIRMNLRTLEWATFIKDFYDRSWDAVCLYDSWPDPWIDNYDEYHSSQDVPRGGNASGWRNDRVDQLLEAMREEFDEEERTKLFHEFNRLFHEEQPRTMLVHGVVGVLQNSRFEEAKVRPTGLQPFSLWVKPENVLHR